MKTGWALGFGQTEVETEYLTFRQVFNGEVASIGDLLHTRLSAAALARYRSSSGVPPPSVNTLISTLTHALLQ